jgi:hypothetical protein
VGGSPREERTPVAQDQSEDGYFGVPQSGTILYRAMREDAGGDPMTGPSARSLGVRPNVDIPVIAGHVQPNTGGMSVAPDRPENLHRLRRPPAYGGSGKDPIWCIPLAALGGDLLFCQDSSTHGLIEPARPMSIDEFQQALQAIKHLWKKLP